MGAFAECPWPIWRVDDLLPCFQTDYLKILLPLMTLGISLTRIAWNNFHHLLPHHKAKGYKSVPSCHSAEGHSRSSSDTVNFDTEDEGDLEINGGRLALAKTMNGEYLVQADTPTGQRLSQAVEELAISALIVVNAIAMVAGAYRYQRGTLAAIVGLVTWVYVLILASLRLSPGTSKWCNMDLWNHTAAIYGLSWVFNTFILRSALIHPSSQLAQILIIVEFALITLLFGMAVTARKGNKTVLLEWEDGVEPSREPLASLFSLVTFSWVDAIVYQGWKKSLEIENVWNLLPRDKAAAVIADYRQLKKTGALTWHLLKFFKGMLLYQFFLAFLAGLFTFAPTLLLRAILEYVEEPNMAPINVLWLYVIGLPVLDTIRSLADGMALWIGRKICIHIRAIIIGEIYAKALRRKAVSGKKILLGDKPAQAKKNDSYSDSATSAKVQTALGLGKKKDSDNDNESANTFPSEAEPSKRGDDEPASLGTIITLMSVDSFKVSEVTAYLHFLFAAAPTQLVISVVLLWQVMGLSAIPGIVVMAFLLPVNYFVARGFNSTSKKIMEATDKRINATNEVLQNIRIIKYFAWEDRFGRIIDEKRRAELNALRSRFVLWACAVAIWNSVPVLITFFSFLAYTLIEKKPLYPSIAFTAISLFMLLRLPLDQLGDMFAHVQEAKVSVDRVEEFLNEEETEKYDQLGCDNVDEDGVKRIGLRDATLIWADKDSVGEDGSQAFQLLDMNVDFEIGKLNIIAGPTGSGKTSMLMGLLGEMTLVNGRVFCPGGRSREEVRPDPATGLADTIAYVAQAAWLVNANIRDNILFAAPYDEQRYRDVIVACGLWRDLEILDNGDETLVGEKGITLSGGQKQRVSLARALYSNSAHVLLDDCLSAVDSQTAQWIFTNCIKGLLMKGRTCVLVTHNVALCVPSADFVVLLDNGRVAAQGPAQDLIDSGKFGEDIPKSRPSSACVSRVPSGVPSSVSDAETMVNSNCDALDDRLKNIKSKKHGANVTDERKTTGAIKWSQFASVATNVWVREWANRYAEEDMFSVALSPVSHLYGAESFAKGTWGTVARLGGIGPKNVTAAATDDQVPFPSPAYPEVNVVYYLAGLAIIGTAGALAAFIRDIWIFFGSLLASKRLHDRLLCAVTRAKFRFFDVTPLGQLMNRFSKDLEAVDQEISPVAIGVLSCALSLVVTVVLIAVITPGFLISALFIAGLFYLVATLYLRTSRELKRLESVQRSPLFQQFGETLSGMTTIRAYGDERRFIRDSLHKVNTQSRPFIYLWACNRWLAFRADALGNAVSFAAGVFIILSLGNVDAGAAGISLSYAMNFTENILSLRVKECLDLEQEAPPVLEDSRVLASWPDKGNIEFVKYTTRYRCDLEPVLKNISLKINAREKVGIVGRTGAGKSSLALAIFRALEAEKGKIVIDDIDIGTIGLRDLRDNITMVPQDPTLFMGTIRTNLDPFDQYTDKQMFEALRLVQLIGPDELSMLPPTPVVQGVRVSRTRLSPGPSVVTNKNIFLNLGSPVTESGSNLSQGQRQLLCLARAILKKPAVLVMDEATASIDYNTDSKIQDTIRGMTGTVITIAHRLQTIVYYDKVLVLDKGEVMEFGHPWELISNEKGSFRSMCEMSGELEVLLKAAKKKWDEGWLPEAREDKRKTMVSILAQQKDPWPLHAKSPLIFLTSWSFTPSRFTPPYFHTTALHTLCSLVCRLTVSPEAPTVAHFEPNLPHYGIEEKRPWKV
ncbi:ATP-dependent bile acid permease [Purpureocillium lavendulum]|uniref:ATP-dependent bile acid permease n=1 Tax=Purpureocillium lavendulum TaxID=1247861 RepID=A0AB34FGA2_9HYPO|nr:ATP-dependent bile acid permease [Purpureocillium lavendulum]